MGLKAVDRLDLVCQIHNPGFSVARGSSRVYETRAEICFQNQEVPRLSVGRDKLWVRTKLAAAGTALPHHLCGDIISFGAVSVCSEQHRLRCAFGVLAASTKAAQTKWRPRARPYTCKYSSLRLPVVIS